MKLGKSVAQDHIVTQGLKVGKITEDYSEEIEEGAVISTNPVAKTKVKKGDTVDIVISKGSRIKKTQVPDLIGLTLKEAEQVLAVVNLKLGSTTAVITDDISRDGKIFNQSEPAQTSVQENEKISVNYYQYKDPDEGKVEVPNFIGRTIEDAQATANSLGLRITVTGDRKGLIISQDVPEGNKLDKGSTINLIAQIKAPNIGGDDDEDEEP